MTANICKYEIMPPGIIAKFVLSFKKKQFCEITSISIKN